MPFKVLIAGGGPAGLEASLALHRLAGERVTTTVLAPDRVLTYRPLSVLAPFSGAETPVFELERIAEDADFTHVHDRLHAVDAEQGTVTTVAGSTFGYDALLVASGARPVPVPNGMVPFSGSRADQARIRAIVGDVEGGHLRRIAFVMPGERTYPLPLYELALLLAERAYQRWVDADLHLVAPHAPLAVFGEDASRAVKRLLALARISVAKTIPDGMERLITVPRLEGPSLPGLPADGHGFLLTDNHGRVRGVEGVYAAGDVTAFPVKQGGLACRQADAAAAHIAALAGADSPPNPFVPDLRGVLLTGHEPRALQRGTRPAPLPAFDPLSKIHGAELTAYLARVRFAHAA